MKTNEIVGSQAVRHLDYDDLRKQNLKYGSAYRDTVLDKGMGGNGSKGAIRGYNDNDITSHLVNSKHTNPTVFAVKSPERKAKPMHQWVKPKGYPLSLQ